MVRFPAVIAVGLAVAAAIAGCGGKVIHLGDGNDGGPCAHGQVSANQVLWIGDSWILVPGGQVTRVQDLARAAGAIGPNDTYVVGAAPAVLMSMIASQYDTQEAGATKVKVLIMDGGTWDTIQANNAGGAAAVPAAATSAANAFSQLLTNVASDRTVQHIIYFLPPEIQTIPGVAELRPLVSQACQQSAVPCHFLDLDSLWTGHPEYTGAGAFLPTDAGAVVLGDAIWALMQQNCVAQ
ncbi:MAG TPA: hypothetical protein VKQ32_19380 [Polyangia bacterium]|nr:hypothetical protein [Polyangia bacterium]